MVADTLELENAAAASSAASRKPRNREVSSRYKTTSAAPTRRFPSPNIGRSVDGAAAAAGISDASKRAFSAERKREADDVSRSLSSSLQMIDPALKPAVNGLGSNAGRTRAATPERKRRQQQQQIDQAENARPLENVGKPESVQIQKWPATANGKSMSRSMDLSLGRMSSIGTRGNRCLAPVRSLNQVLGGKQTGKVPSHDPAAEEKEKSSEIAAGATVDESRRVRRSVDEKPREHAAVDDDMKRVRRLVDEKTRENAAAAADIDTKRVRRLVDEKHRENPVAAAAVAADDMKRVRRSVEEKTRENAAAAVDDTKRVRRSVDEASCCGTDEFAENGDEESMTNTTTATAAAATVHTVKASRPVRGTVVPARFWQDLNNRIRRLSDVNQLRASVTEGDGPRTVRRSAKVITSAPTSAHSSAGNSPAGNPTPWIYSPVRVPPAPPPPLSPSGTVKVSSPSRAVPSPTRTRPSGGARPGSVACMLNFGGDVSSRGRKGMSQQEEAQYLRILHNRWLQWRFVNARAESTLSSQQASGERLLYSTSMQISDLQNRVAEKRIRLQKARVDAKVNSSIASHGECLEEWARLEQEHTFCLSGATEALEAATLKVPVIGGAKVDAQTLRLALNSAAEAMTPLDSTTRALLPRAEKTCEIVRQLAQTSAQGKALLQECGELLDIIAAVETEDRSLRSYFVQLEKERKQRAE